MGKKDWMRSLDMATRVAVLVFALAVCMVFIVAGAKAATAVSLRSETTISGDGWTLTVAPGWMIREGPRQGDYEVVRRAP